VPSDKKVNAGMKCAGYKYEKMFSKTTLLTQQLKFQHQIFI